MNKVEGVGLKAAIDDFFDKLDMPEIDREEAARVSAWLTIKQHFPKRSLEEINKASRETTMFLFTILKCAQTFSDIGGGSAKMLLTAWGLELIILDLHKENEELRAAASVSLNMRIER